jgi:ribose 5-phosphate isomerase A
LLQIGPATHFIFGHFLPMSTLTQDELKALVGRAALQYIEPGQIVGVGTGSTVNKFIDALASVKDRIRGAVSSSEASTARLRALGIEVWDANEVERLSVYVDGADEIDPHGCMIKGGGAALTREKIVAALADRFVCIADESKWVETLGHFPLPVEVIPMAAQQIARRFAALGGQARLRLKDGAPWVTDNGQHILDVSGLRITEPLAFESMVNDWPGVVTVGVFAHQKASVCLLGTAQGVRTVEF